MDFVIADKDRMELGFLPKDAELDLDLSEKTNNKDGCNDAELKVKENFLNVDFGNYIFLDGTEYGGRIMDLKRNTASATAVWYLDTWRRMLGQAVIEPPAGMAYLQVVNKDANTVISDILGGRFGDIFTVPKELSGIPISGQFDRYTTVLDGLTKILKSHRARLRIKSVQGDAGQAFWVQVEAVPVVDYSEEIEYSQDNRVNLNIRDYRRGINHLICLGKGELTERMVRHLYIQKDGSISYSKFYSGIDERTEVFEYPNAEDENELLEAGRERLKELANYKKMEMSVRDLDLDIGDVVAGRDRVTGMYMKKPIVKKVLKVKNGRTSISYKVKGEE